jgi:hypothetical protein
MESNLSKVDDSYFKSYQSMKKDESVTDIDKRFENLLLSESFRNINPSTIRNLYTKSDFEDFQLCGKGSYAKVIKAVHKKSSEVKAIKIIDKNYMDKVGKIIKYRKINYIKFIWSMIFYKILSILM